MTPNPLPPLGGPKDKFTPELRILVASLLSMVVILLWAKFFGPKPPGAQPQQTPAAQTAPAAPGNSAGPSATTKIPATPSTLSAASAPAAVPMAESQERTIVVENSLYRVEFSNRGAVVKSWQLKNYKDDAKPQRVLDLVHDAASQLTGGWPFGLVLDDEQMQSTVNNGLYRAWVSEPGAGTEAHSQNYAVLPPNPLKAPTELD